MPTYLLLTEYKLRLMRSTQSDVTGTCVLVVEGSLWAGKGPSAADSLWKALARPAFFRLTTCLKKS